MRKKRRLWDEYRFPGFYPKEEVQGIFGDHKARVIPLQRRQKKQSVGVAAHRTEASTTGRCDGFETLVAARRGFICQWRSGESFAEGAEW